MKDNELIELYKRRNELFKDGNINESNKITEEIEKKLPSKDIKRGFRDSNGNIVQFEIVDARNYTSVDKLKSKSTFLVKDKDSAINGKPTYARILIKRRL